MALAALRARLFRRDEPGLLIASSAHALVFAAAVVGFAKAPPSFADAQEALPVEVISAEQLAAMTRGEKMARAVLPTPQPRVDRVAPVKEEKDPGEAKREAVAPPPPPRPETAPEVRPEEAKTAATPPAPPARPEPTPPPIPVARPPLRPAATEAPEPEVEAVRQAKAEVPRKVEPKEEAKPEANKVAKAEPQKPEPPKPEAKPQPPKADPVREALKRDDILKALASAKEKAPEAKPPRPKTEAADASFDSDAIRRKLVASKEPAAATGSTGERANRQASLGTATGAAAKLSMSDREALAGMLREQMERCWSLSGAQNPVMKPLVKVSLLPSGELAAQPVLANAGGEPAFRAIAESGMRAIRQCAPYRIPAKFAASYDDWKQLNVRLDPSDLL